jgi:glycosyltransferase involved in cell wall biosynthesis
MPAVGSGRTPILYLAPWVDLGGSDKGTIDWFKHIDRGRWAPSLITTQPSSNRWVHHLESYAEEVWELPDLMPGGDFPSFILGFIESRGVELVHIMNSRLAFDLLPDMTCLRHPPAVVVQMHAEEPDRSGYVRYVSTRYGNLVDAFSVTSEQLKAAVAEYEIPPSRIEVIYSGVDAEEEFNPDRAEPFERAEGVPHILWPGRLTEQKDPMLTLDVLAAVRDRGARFVLDIVGDGHMAADVRARAERLGIAEMIEWHPPSQQMARWYRSSDVVLMTSVFEGATTWRSTQTRSFGCSRTGSCAHAWGRAPGKGCARTSRSPRWADATTSSTTACCTRARRPRRSAPPASPRPRGQSPRPSRRRPRRSASPESALPSAPWA